MHTGTVRGLAKALLLVGLTVSWLVFVPYDALAQAGKMAKEFDALSQELGQMQSLFRQEGATVTFDAEEAKKQGYSNQAVKLAEELTAYTNDILDETALRLAEDPKAIPADPKHYKLLNEYLEEATRRAAAGESSVPPAPPSDELVTSALVPLAGEIYCGTYWNPLPPQGKSTVRVSSTNHAAALTSLGFHQTPDYAGGGWTRAQNHMWWICGFGTFRDHAFSITSAEYGIQNYEGWSPRGEPNPEVWRTGPWPYATWPAYVRWWHSRY
jgi:hypothetical protein